MITLSEIQKRLREAIITSGKKQTEIALAINVSPVSINKYLRQDKFPALDTLANLCRYLGVSANYILLGEDY